MTPDPVKMLIYGCSFDCQSGESLSVMNEDKLHLVHVRQNKFWRCHSFFFKGLRLVCDS
jgi:hypothetical protein